MKKALLLIALLSLTIPSFAQVNVRGYYRSNGTYVQPYQRTAPDYTPRNNYSYPGNYNPNTSSYTPSNSYSQPVYTAPRPTYNTGYSRWGNGY